MVFVVDITGAYAEMSNYKLMNLTIKVDGNAIAVDLDKILVGDLENKGNYRIEIYNEYGNSKTNPGIKLTDLAFEKTLEVIFELDSDGKENVAGEQTAQITKDAEVSVSEMESLISSNASSPIAIQNDTNVLFVFDAGEMKLVDGITNYDFTTSLLNNYTALVEPPFAEDTFIMSVIFNYSGKLPGEAEIYLPVGKELAGTKLYYYEVKTDGSYAYVDQGKVNTDGYLVVKQDHCSNYVVSSFATADAPNTGDFDMTMVYMLLLAGCVFVFVGLISKKKFA